MNSSRPFSLSKALITGFSTYVENFNLFAKATVACYGLYALLAIFGVGLISSFRTMAGEELATPSMKGLGVLLYLLLVLCFGIVQCYYHHQILRFGLKLSHGETSRWTDLFRPNGTFGSFLCARFLYALRNRLWSILLIIPGIYQATAYLFSGYSIVDQQSNSVWQDKKYAHMLSSGIRWPLFGLLVLGYTLTILSFGLLTPLFKPILILTRLAAYKQRIAGSSAIETYQ